MTLIGKDGIKAFLKGLWKLFLDILKGLGALLFIYIVTVPIWIYSQGRENIYTDLKSVTDYRVAIVLGAAVTPEGEPREMLQDRLDVAADLFEAGNIEKILVSGDNQEENYNEPLAMYHYLVDERALPEDAIAMDFAGRRTYDTCARAKEVFELSEVVLVSQGYHLPRAIFLCNELGVEAKGVSATLNSNYKGEGFFKFREFWAIHKAIYDIYVESPAYVGGEVIDIFTQ